MRKAWDLVTGKERGGKMHRTGKKLRKQLDGLDLTTCELRL